MKKAIATNLALDSATPAKDGFQSMN